MKFLILFMLMSFTQSLASADLVLAPPNFSVESKNFVFVDFQTANYKIEIDFNKQVVEVHSQIAFTMPESGYAVFDAVENLYDAELDEISVNIRETFLPKRISRVKYIDQIITAGSYVLTTKNQLNSYASFDSDSIKMAMWKSDLSDRSFLEKYMPSNLDYDSYQMNFQIYFIGTDKVHNLQTNCNKTLVSQEKIYMSCPTHFNSSSLFFHLFEESRFNVETSTYKSMDGKNIVISVYGPTTNVIHPKIAGIMEELENDYGPWPYDFFVVYANESSGGMEYSGATATGLRALGHEMHHMYFARSSRPVGGNGGWIDEALASWCDNGYKSRSALSNRHVTKMASRSVYDRVIDTKAYFIGAEIIEHLEFLTYDMGGMRSFMKHFHMFTRFLPFTTEMFKTSLETYFVTDFTELFDTYIYGKNSVMLPSPMSVIDEDHMHKISEQELYDML